MDEQRKNHPLIQKILDLVEYDPMYENMGIPEMRILYLSDLSKNKIQQEYAKYFESVELNEVITALLRLAVAFDREGHNALYISILEIVVTANETLAKRKISG